METLYQASSRECRLLEIKVTCGRNVSLGYWNDKFDTPDPYVKLYIKTAPNGRKRTKAKNNTVNPTWGDVFHFCLDPEIKNTLEISLMDSDTITRDDMVDTQIYDLSNLKDLNKVYHETFKFRQVSEVDVEMKLETCSAPSDMRYSTELCKEETDFLDKRKQVVFQAMNRLLGVYGPRNLDEVPSVAVLGSGGGFRAMVSLSGVFCALKNMGVLDCVMYAAGLSGSAWYLSKLYSHPAWPNAHPSIIRDNLKKNVEDKWYWLLLTPSWMRRRLNIIRDKKSRGQPVNFVDFFGYLVGDTILNREDVAKLSEQRLKVEDARVPLPLYSGLHVKRDVSAKNFCEWLEFSPYEIGMAKYGTFIKSEHFGSKFFCGQLLNSYPEPPLHYMQGIWGSAFAIIIQRFFNVRLHPNSNLEEEPLDMDHFDNKGHEEIQLMEEDEEEEEESDEEETDDDTFSKRFIKSVIKYFPFLGSRTGRAGMVHNFLRGLNLTTGAGNDVTDDFAVKAKRMYVVDSGLAFNSPYPLLLRPQRNVDILLSFDFSFRRNENEMPFKNLLKAEEWARKNNTKFPPINAEEQYEEDDMKEFYVFKDPEDPSCPVVVHFVLCNVSFKKQSSPGVPRTTKDEIEFADFSVFEDRKRAYWTSNFHYPEEPFDRLAKLNEFNTLLAEQTIKDVLAECVKKKRGGKKEEEGRGGVRALINQFEFS